LNSGRSVEAKLRIARTAVLSINSLATDAGGADLLCNLLRETASEVSGYLKMGHRNPEKLFQLFSEFRATLDPRIFWHYDTNGNAFVINLLFLLYTPAWRLASAFVHEAQHVLFLKRRGMLGAPEPQQEDFARKFRRETEIQAHKAELRFLLSIRRHVPSKDRTYVTLTKYRIHDLGDVIGHIAQTLRMLEADKDAKASKYEDAIGNRAPIENAKIASVLGIEPPKPSSDGMYREVTIAFRA